MREKSRKERKEKNRKAAKPPSPHLNLKFINLNQICIVAKYRKLI